MVKSRVSLCKQAVVENNGLVGFITDRSCEGLYSFESENGITVVGLTETQFKKVSPKYKGRARSVSTVPTTKKISSPKVLGNLKVIAAFNTPVGMSGEDFYVTRVGLGRNCYKVYASRRPGDATTNPSNLFVDWFHLALIDAIDEAYTDAYVLYCNHSRLSEIEKWAKQMDFNLKVAY